MIAGPAPCTKTIFHTAQQRRQLTQLAVTIARRVGLLFLSFTAPLEQARSFESSGAAAAASYSCIYSLTKKISAAAAAAATTATGGETTATEAVSKQAVQCTHNSKSSPLCWCLCMCNGSVSNLGALTNTHGQRASMGFFSASPSPTRSHSPHSHLAVSVGQK